MTWGRKRKRTWLPVSNSLSMFPNCTFQKRICLSCVPPPVARTPATCGSHASALTAAVCSWNFHNGDESPGCAAVIVPSSAFRRREELRRSHMHTLLSLPPLASRPPCAALSEFHRSPQTSCRCPALFRKGRVPGSRTSRWCTIRSREPELSTWLFHASAPIRCVCACW